MRYNVLLIILGLVASTWTTPLSIADDMLKTRMLAQLARNRKIINTVEVSLNVSERCCKDSYTAIAIQRYNHSVTGPIPPRDIVLDYKASHTFDFTAPQSATKGFKARFELMERGDGKPFIDAYTEWQQSATNGKFAYSYTPREKLHPQSIPAGIKYPVEFVSYAILDGGVNAISTEEVYPLFFWAGAMPDPNQPISLVERRPVADLSTWKVEGPSSLNGMDVVLLTSPPNAQGDYYQYSVAEDLGYRPLKWTCLMRSGQRTVCDIIYERKEGSVIVKSWTFSRFNPDRVLTQEYNASVLSFIANPPLSSDSFVLKPIDGVIVEEMIGTKRLFSVAGSNEDPLPTNFDLNRRIDAHGLRYGMPMLIAICIFIAAIFAIYFRVRGQSFRRFTQRS